MNKLAFMDNEDSIMILAASLGMIGMSMSFLLGAVVGGVVTASVIAFL